MRVYFNLISSADQILDPQGVEVVDLDHAYAEAESAIAELFQEQLLTIHAVSGWRFDVVNASGVLLFSINLDSVND